MKRVSTSEGTASLIEQIELGIVRRLRAAGYDASYPPNPTSVKIRHRSHELGMLLDDVERRSGVARADLFWLHYNVTHTLKKDSVVALAEVLDVPLSFFEAVIASN
jgi:hypothetical protein